MNNKVKSTKVNISESELEIIKTFMKNEKRSFSYVVSEAVSKFAKELENQKAKTFEYLEEQKNKKK